MKTATLKQTVEFEGVRPRDVYDDFLSSRGHSEMTGGDAKMSGKVGGKFTAWDGYIWGTNKELVPGKKIVQAWRTSEFPEDAEDSILKIELSATKTGTKLALTHSNIPDGQEKSYGPGWKENYWTPMKAYFSAGRK
ncbi:MAG TPA: SRPBCC domain-containing protein [Candidatus Norongarragalinales archaeon]|nr:SRPBCC domain-containing protein [Candidatus Norongarragalinales archaeon]